MSLRAKRSEDPQSPDNLYSVFRGWRVKPAMTDFLLTNQKPLVAGLFYNFNDSLSVIFTY